MSARRMRLLGWGVLLVLAVLVPFFFGSYRVGQFTQAMALAIAVLGLNLLVGYSGQISLGHGAFFALGAYASAISILDLDVLGDAELQEIEVAAQPAISVFDRAFLPGSIGVAEPRGHRAGARQQAMPSEGGVVVERDG